MTPPATCVVRGCTTARGRRRGGIRIPVRDGRHIARDGRLDGPGGAHRPARAAISLIDGIVDYADTVGIILGGPIEVAIPPIPIGIVVVQTVHVVIPIVEEGRR
jgi:hypothetical protein